MTATASSAAHAAYRAQRHFQNLDGLRFLCIGMVLWHHAPVASAPDWQILTRGFLGVDFFFVLSGFLITTLLLRESDTYGAISLKDFYIRRAIRILPVYYFVVTIVSAYYIFLDGRTDFIRLVPFYYLFLSNFLVEDITLLSITWSLSIEEQYYIIWPLLLVILPRNWFLPVGGALVALNMAIGTGIIPLGEVVLDPIKLAMPISTYAPIILGSIAAILLHSPRGFAMLWSVAHHRAAGAIGLVGLAVLLQLLPFDVSGWPNIVIHVTMTYVVIALVAREDSVLAPVLTNRFIARYGVVSYGIYLYHLIALHIVNVLCGKLGLDNGWLILFGYGLLSYLIAEASFHTLEAYFRRFRPAPRSAAKA